MRQRSGYRSRKIRLKEDSERPRFRQIQQFILKRISDGSLPAGTRLPPLRKWAAEIGVAYETMSKAIRELKAAGVLEARPRRGTVVAPRGPLMRERVGAVGIVSAGPYRDLIKTSRYYGHLMPIVQDELMAHHERVVHERWTPAVPMSEMFRHLKLVDGLLLLGNVPYPVAQIKAVEKLGVPLVCAGGEIEHEAVCVVKTDDIADCREAVLELARMGHRRIAAWGSPGDLRIEGYRKGLKDAGLPEDRQYVFTDPKPDLLLEHLLRLRTPAAALFIMRHLDRVEKLLELLDKRGIRPGRDLYLCSYDDDLWHNIEPLGIPYARIEQPVRELARVAADVLLARVEGSLKTPTHTLLRSRFRAIPAVGQ